MKTQHTQGEWELCGSGNQFSIAINHSSNEKPDVAVINTHGIYEDTEARANAKLIAAAPELLRCLNFASTYLEEYADNGDAQAKKDLKNIQQAIKKATE